MDKITTVEAPSQYPSPPLACWLALALPSLACRCECSHSSCPLARDLAARLTLLLVLPVVLLFFSETKGGARTDVVMSAGSGAEYYVVTRLFLLGALLLVSTQCGSMLYLRFMLGREEVARDGVPFLLCSLAQSVAWGQLLLLLLRTLDLAGDGAVPNMLQALAAACLYALTPFAYLFHEAVGVGHWGLTGFAGRAVEASMVLGLVAIMTHGLTTVLAELLADAPAELAVAASAASAAGAAAGP